MSLRRIRAPFVALALLVLGCQPVETPPVAKPVPAAPPSAPAADVPATPPPAPAADPALAAMTGEGSVITLLEAGAEPREPLRLKLTAGQEQAMVMTMRMAMSMQIGAQDAPKTSIPPMQMTMNLAVKDITADGDIHSAFSLDKIEVLPDPGSPPELVDQLKTMLGTMATMSGTSVLTTRGIVKSAEFNIPADVNPQIRQTVDSMRQQINQLSVPFPEEALGVGAKWTVTQHLEQQGMKLQQVATWELKARDGDIIKLASAIVQEAPPQQIVSPGMPPGAKVTLERLSSSGSGTTELDLGRVAPIQGTMTMTSSIAMKTETEGGTMPLTMNMDLGLDISGK